MEERSFIFATAKKGKCSYHVRQKITLRQGIKGPNRKVMNRPSTTGGSLSTTSNNLGLWLPCMKTNTKLKLLRWTDGRSPSSHNGDTVTRVKKNARCAYATQLFWLKAAARVNIWSSEIISHANSWPVWNVAWVAPFTENVHHTCEGTRPLVHLCSHSRQWFLWFNFKPNNWTLDCYDILPTQPQVRC